MTEKNLTDRWWFWAILLLLLWWWWNRRRKKAVNTPIPPMTTVATPYGPMPVATSGPGPQSRPDPAISKNAEPQPEMWIDKSSGPATSAKPVSATGPAAERDTDLDSLGPEAIAFLGSYYWTHGRPLYQSYQEARSTGYELTEISARIRQLLEDHFVWHRI